VKTTQSKTKQTTNKQTSKEASKYREVENGNNQMHQGRAAQYDFIKWWKLQK
jgi:hypothetical protein